MGQRGERPVVFSTNVGGERLRGILQIPGVERVQGGLRCAWDVAWAVARLIGQQEPAVPTYDGPMPGLERYRQLGLHEKTRPYQKEDILFLARRAYAVLAEPMRSGKTLMALGADVLVDSRRSLILGPAAARWVWAEECDMWTGTAALLLSGRGVREARLYCLVCHGRGTMPNGTQCQACKQRNGQSYGEHIYDVCELVPQPTRKMTGEILWDNVGKFACPKHPWVIARESGLLCGECKRELLKALRDARYVIANYELLVAQHGRLGGGQTYLREDLGGWAPTLAEVGFDVAICDEGHMLRGWTTSQGRLGHSRRERVREALWNVPRVWMVTGTPFYGFTRDIWGQLDIASRGLWSDHERGVPGRRFMQRYCEGHKAQYGFQAKGRSIYAETELVRRLRHVMIKRPRSEIFEHVPPKTRRVIRLDVDGVRPFVPGMRSRTALADMIRELSDKKRELVLDRLLGEMAEGERIIVFCFHVPSAKKMFKAIEKAVARGAYRARMAEVNAKVWLATGLPRKKDGTLEEGVVEDEEMDDRSAWAQSVKARHELARRFREHEGAGALVATIDSMPVAISLKGASAVHFLDLHWSPGAMAQAEDRPYSHDIRGLGITYYVARKSVDDHIEAEVLPKVETLVRIAREKGAEAMLEAFGQREEQRSFEAVCARLMAHLRRGVDGSARTGDDR